MLLPSHVPEFASSVMPFTVRQEPFESVRDELVAVLNATRAEAVGGERFEWLYRDNPDGRAVIWTLRDDCGHVGGFTACLPRRMWADGSLRLAWNGADFSILPQYRSLGLAVRLRRAARERIDAGEAAFLYSHPNERMAAIHRRVGHPRIGRMVRVAVPIRVAPYLRRTLRPTPVAAAAGWVAEPLYRTFGPPRRRRRTSDVSEARPASFPDEFDELFDRKKPASGVIGVRDATYLNWRWRACPLYESKLLRAERSGKLAGYLLLVSDGDVGHVKDLFPPDDRGIAADLVAGAVREARRRGLSSLSFTALHTNPLLDLCRELGFRDRPDGSDMYGYAPEHPEPRPSALIAERWFLTVGDRDV